MFRTGRTSFRAGTVRRDAPERSAATLLARPLRAVLAATALVLGLAGMLGAQDTSEPPMMVVEVRGAIGPATTHLIEQAIGDAEAAEAAALVIALDTPGGLVTATRDITSAILDAEIPVIGYVSPGGARAASAGTYMIYATHLAAMAPGTNIGAATPVRMGGAPGGDAPREDDTDDEDTEDTERTRPEDAGMAKATNDAVAWIRSLAELRGRNADWAERAVREAVSLSANEAVEKNVVALVADDLADLAARIDGREVDLGGETIALATADAPIERIEPSLTTEILQLLTNPNVAFLLMTLGTYGLIFELANPGVGPGVPGVICLVLGLYALNQLPLDYAGLALVALGLAFMTAEAFTPTFGILGLGGLAAFVGGSAMLIDTDVPGYQLDWSVILTVAALGVGLLCVILGVVWRAQGGAQRTGAPAMIGGHAEVIDWADTRGHVYANGERWQAEGPEGLVPGDDLVIEALEGLVLHVRRADHAAPGPNQIEGAR
ncbi:MAG: nodulation protein NfeD [Paracoccaceae bacterium]